MAATDIVPPPIQFPPSAEVMRTRVRAFLAEGGFEPSCDNWLSGWDEEFSRRLGAAGLIGLTIPTRYGGHGCGPLERFAVTEELLAAGAPVAAHWIADRQIAPSLLRYGTEEQKHRYLPAIAGGGCYFAIGMSEPDAGSDLAAVRTRATPGEGGWRLTGTKIWTSGAHRANAIVVLAREEGARTAGRHAGLGQFIVEAGAPGLTIRPIRALTGAHDFNEVVLDEVFVPDAMVLGDIGQGWNQVTSELSFERSGPERFLSTFPLLDALIGRLRELGRRDDACCEAIGGLVSRVWTLRSLSLAVAGALDRGEPVDVAAALVKELGTRFESTVAEVARTIVEQPPDPTADEPYERILAQAVLHAPGFTLRGGTNEILLGIVARGMGLR